MKNMENKRGSQMNRQFGDLTRALTEKMTNGKEENDQNVRNTKH